MDTRKYQFNVLFKLLFIYFIRVAIVSSLVALYITSVSLVDTPAIYFSIEIKSLSKKTKLLHMELGKVIFPKANLQIGTSIGVIDENVEEHLKIRIE